MLFRRNRLSVAVLAVLTGSVLLSGCGDDGSDGAAGATGADGAASVVASVEFTSTPAPSSYADMVATTTSSKAIVTYADGTSEEYPLSYNVLFKNTDTIGNNEAGRLYDVNGSPLFDANGAPVISETPDANSLLTVGGKHYW